jgi:hypothetical protein
MSEKPQKKGFLNNVKNFFQSKKQEKKQPTSREVVNTLSAQIDELKARLESYKTVERTGDILAQEDADFAELEALQSKYDSLDIKTLEQDEVKIDKREEQIAKLQKIEDKILDLQREIKVYNISHPKSKINLAREYMANKKELAELEKQRDAFVVDPLVSNSGDQINADDLGFNSSLETDHTPEEILPQTNTPESSPESEENPETQIETAVADLRKPETELDRQSDEIINQIQVLESQGGNPEEVAKLLEELETIETQKAELQKARAEGTLNLVQAPKAQRNGFFSGFNKIKEKVGGWFGKISDKFKGKNQSVPTQTPLITQTKQTPALKTFDKPQIDWKKVANIAKKVGYGAGGVILAGGAIYIGAPAILGMIGSHAVTLGLVQAGGTFGTGLAGASGSFGTFGSIGLAGLGKLSATTALGGYTASIIAGMGSGATGILSALSIKKALKKEQPKALKKPKDTLDEKKENLEKLNENIQQTIHNILGRVPTELHSPELEEGIKNAVNYNLNILGDSKGINTETQEIISPEDGMPNKFSHPDLTGGNEALKTDFEKNTAMQIKISNKTGEALASISEEQRTPEFANALQEKLVVVMTNLQTQGAMDKASGELIYDLNAIPEIMTIELSDGTIEEISFDELVSDAISKVQAEQVPRVDANIETSAPTNPTTEVEKPKKVIELPKKVGQQVALEPVIISSTPKPILAKDNGEIPPEVDPLTDTTGKANIPEGAETITFDSPWNEESTEIQEQFTQEEIDSLEKGIKGKNVAKFDSLSSDERAKQALDNLGWTYEHLKNQNIISQAQIFEKIEESGVRNFQLKDIWNHETRATIEPYERKIIGDAILDILDDLKKKS